MAQSKFAKIACLILMVLATVSSMRCGKGVGPAITAGLNGSKF